jgi:FixJ family two-component response regulator
LDEDRSIEEHLVSTLDRDELQILVCLVRGMANRDIATSAEISLEEVKRLRASMTMKVGAKCAADVVRIALRAGLDRAN